MTRGSKEKEIIYVENIKKNVKKGKNKKTYDERKQRNGNQICEK